MTIFIEINSIVEGNLAQLQQAEDRINKSNVAAPKKKKSKFSKAKWDAFKDSTFDSIVKDGKVSADERAKMVKRYGSDKFNTSAFKHGIMNAIADDKYDSSIDPNAAPDTKKADKPTPYKVQQGEKLSTKEHIRLERSIFDKDKPTMIKIYKRLIQLYNDKFVKVTEAVNINISNRELSNELLIKILTSLYNIYSKNLRKIQEADSTKLSNNVVTRKWAQIGKPSSIDGLVKLMKMFKLSDIQIFGIFERNNKKLSYSDITRLQLDIISKPGSVTDKDLDKLANTLGKLGTSQLIAKLSKTIKSN